jgi:hypothetical protein
LLRHQLGQQAAVAEAEASSEATLATAGRSGIDVAARSASVSWLSKLWLWATAILTIASFGAAIAMAPPASTPADRGLVWLLFLGSSVHVASTAWLYTRSEVRRHAARRQLRYVWVPIGLVVVTAVMAATMSEAMMTWFLLPYFAWQFFHFQKQNLGMAALAASAHGVTRLSRAERRAIVVAGVAGIIGLVSHPGLLQVGVLYRMGWLFDAGGLLLVGSVGAGLAAFARRPLLDRPTAFTAIYVLSLVFSLPIFIFGSPYAAVGGMTIAHGLQYLLLMGLVAAGTRPRSSRGLRIAVLFNIALFGGVALSTASHLHSSSAPVRLLFGAYLGVVMAHFVIDAGFWRIRDPFPRQFLTRHLPYLVQAGPGVLLDDRSSADIQ